MDFRTLSPRTLRLLDVATFEFLLPFMSRAVGDDHEVDLQVVHLDRTRDYKMLLHVLDGDRVERGHEIWIRDFDDLPEAVQLAIMIVQVQTLQDGAGRSRIRAAAGLRQIDRQQGPSEG